MPFLPISPDFAKNLERRVEMVENDIMPPTYKMVLNKYFPLPEHQSPVLPQHQEIPSCSQSLSCIEPELLGTTRPRVSLTEHRQVDGKISSWRSRL